MSLRLPTVWRAVAEYLPTLGSVVTRMLAEADSMLPAPNETSGDAS